MDPHTQRAEAERWLGIAAKLLTARDFLGSKTFAIRAREADPNNAVSDQILAVVDTVLAGEKRVKSNQQPDWYSVLQLPRLVRDPDLIADHYRRLVLCLNPERNRFPFADYALQLVMDAWSVLSDPTKKWLFDNELALYLQHEQISSTTVDVAAGSGSNSVVGSASGGNNQLNTFQFFQQQPPMHQQQQPHQQPQQQQQQQPMWQQQQQPQINQREFMPLPNQQQQPQINQREFMPLPNQQQQQQQQQQQHPQQQQQQQIPAQWQMRDPMPSKPGERNKGVINEIGAAISPTQSTPRPVSQAPPPVPQPRPASPTQPAVVTMGANVGHPGIGTDSNNIDVTAANTNDDINGVGVNVDVNDEEVNDGEDNDDVVVEEVESFWTACPYCFYIFEYEKMYQGCTLRCQNCRRGFYAVQIPNPPPISDKNGGDSGGGDGKEKGRNKDKENSFCCWGFFPLGFSMTAWKKHNQNGTFNGSSNWTPFSPMFASPFADGGGGFKWFNNSGGDAFVGPKNRQKTNTPRVYIDDDDVLEYSEPSDLDLSDGDWRSYKIEKSKKKKQKASITGRKRGRPRKVDVLNQEMQASPFQLP
ncbi:unnamed protein product [Amaranthus hypochondriacus]